MGEGGKEFIAPETGGVIGDFLRGVRLNKAMGACKVVQKEGAFTG
jgi:hypothetical protein